ncbi:T9SS type B sorting domain-containing protein [Neolewinella aurantiaca]|uniref:T9SS type B sorting domain-containing protein n=1 Tax=Neolewinella aurantiaca TaxID=2602767 RepID=A0A5C7FU36_9BACT|nr:gliding motility-associated C-terminal domain-containing protein [Neolewinella aurantiaca]TXF88903.1 T9SS type B sorting domain-containing protein [Neolewinella aurantiaca]
MKISQSLVVLLCLVSATLTAQVEQANNWHFGDELSVSFVGGTPVLNPPSAMEAFEGIVSMSDDSGQLLFYTNGGGQPADPILPDELQPNPGIIWNRNHEVMYDMRGEEGGGYSARQSSIAMPDPAGEDGVYYLFTMEEAEFNVGGAIPGQPLGRGLSYFIIDMNLNGGLGGVRTADQRVVVPAYEALDATPMADGSGYWIICHNNDQGDSKFIVVPLTAAGTGTPVEYPTSRVSGKIKFSPNGLFMFNDRKLYSFDNETGAIASDPADIPGVSNQITCFTPDSRFLYTTETRAVIGEVIVRYDLRDLNEPPLVLDRVNLSTGEPVFLTANFQIGPNGNIYFLEQTFDPGTLTRYGLSEITCVSGENPMVNRFIIDLPVADGADFLSQHLPQFVDAIFAVEPSPDTIRLDTTFLAACDDEVLTLTARDSGTNYSWTTGDTTATTVVSAAGTYCVTVTGDCFPVVDCQTVTYEQTGINAVVIGEDDLGCAGFRCVVDLDVDAAFSGVKVSLYETNPLGTEILVDEFLSASDTVSLDKPEDGQQYRIEVTYENCGQIEYPLILDFPEDDRFRPELNVTADGEICNGRDITLEVTNDDGTLAIASVRYDDGNTDNPRTLPAAFETDIPVTVFSECGDSVVLIYTGPVAEFCDCDGEIPELITPNGDNVNDEFRLYSDCPAEDYTLMIFNRWGQPVFESTNYEQAWDGTVDGSPQNSDLYLYRMVFRFTDSDAVIVREGQFSLVR